MAEDRPDPQEEFARSIARVSKDLPNMTRDDLLKAAEALRDSGLDRERLIRLSKIAAKAADLEAPGVVAYHY